ncbi:MAG: hypothetical protein IT311_01010 [Anaerolineales bacterium]|nr:hypothetical protein [Anaerolineales bacterium]MCZ2123178.1 phospholipase D-like domain-containing protein [Anaerolineales bacterium]
MKRLFSWSLLLLMLAACAPVDQFSTPYAQAVTQIPFYITETPPPFIIPITETPNVIVPVTDTPFIVTPTPFVVTEIPLTAPVAAQWWEVYFTDPLVINDPENIAGSIEEKIIHLIDAAQSSIHIASFEFNLTPVAQALINAKNRGVDVKWMADDKNGLNYDTQPGRGQFAMLAQAGIELKDDGRTSLMHNKFWIFDQEIVWTGSTNITVNGIFKQNNNVLVIRSRDIAYIYEREFQEMWSGQFGPRAPSTVNTQWAILDGTPIQILFSAEDRAVDKLIALVKDAKTSIRFLAFSFTDYPLAQAMIDRAKAGVDLKGIYETFGSNSAGSELKTFICAGVNVRRDGNESSFLHDKIIIIDNAIVVTGSLNYSSSADEENDENVVILDNPEIAALYVQEFEKNWLLAKEVPQASVTCE